MTWLGISTFPSSHRLTSDSYLANRSAKISTSNGWRAARLYESYKSSKSAGNVPHGTNEFARRNFQECS
jgi:hypothetical protein